MRRLAIAIAGSAAALSVASAAPPLALSAASAVTQDGPAGVVEHRAAVIVDTGAGVTSVCVRFREDSISGVEALVRAQVDPVLHGFSGKGAAVCALCGVGCPAGDSCLTCNPAGRFWSYSRAPAGTGALRTSGVGASATTVRDGDVEGWRWGLGGTPPFASVEQVCGEAPATPATTAPPVPGATPVDPVLAAPAAQGSPGPALTPTPTRPATPPTAVRTTTTLGDPTPGIAPTTAAASGAPEPQGLAPGVGPGAASGQTAAGRGGPAGAGSRGPGLALFAAVLVVLVGWGRIARRARPRGTSPPA